MSTLENLKVRYSKIEFQIEALQTKKTETLAKLEGLGFKTVEDAEKHTVKLEKELEENETKYNELLAKTETAITEIETKLNS